MALATSGSAFGQLIIVPAAAFTLARTDWHTVYRSLALLLLVVIAPLVVLFVREAPGARDRRSRHLASDGQPAPNASLRASLNGSAFWLLAFGFFVCGFTMAFANTHFLAYADDMGMAPVDASHIVAATAVFSILGSVLLGIAADRYPRQAVLALTYALRGLAFAFLLLLPAGGLTYVYAVVLGISWTATTPLTAAIAADLYGRLRLGVIFGTMFTFMNLGFGAGAFLDGVAYDLMGNYRGALVVNVLLGLLAAGAVSLVKVAREPLEIQDVVPAQAGVGVPRSSHAD
jgi:predicted MFS family arabinose efflux permease